MHRGSVALLLFLGVASVGFAADAGLGPLPAMAQAEQKVIKDPAEYNAYIAALNMAEPAGKGAAMEAFVAQYPASVVKVDALEQAMVAYQQAGNIQKLEQVARKLVDAEADNVRPVAVLTTLLRMQATQGDDSKVGDICSFAQRGTTFLASWSKPANLSDADFARLRSQMAEIFYGGSGFCGLKKKTYNYARDNYLKALQINPGDMVNNFQLGTAELENYPMEINGFWYLARAVHLAQSQNNADAAASIAQYGKAKYKRYHGGEDGWDQLLASVADQSAPPAGFAASVKKAPSEAEQACIAVRDNNPSDLSFADWEFVLEHRDDSPCNLDAAGKVWAAIQKLQKNGQAKLKLEAKVISTTRDSMGVAITDEHQKSGEIDLEVVMARPMPTPPTRGAMVNLVGVITKYKARPFFFEMEGAEFSLVETGPGASRP